jgi:hypothetical protein
VAEPSGKTPNLIFDEISGLDMLPRLYAAVELHRPTMADKWGRPTTEIEGADPRYTRCSACGRGVTIDGCDTWRTAYPPEEGKHICENKAKCWGDPDCPKYSTRAGGAQ